MVGGVAGSQAAQAAALAAATGQEAVAAATQATGAAAEKASSSIVRLSAAENAAAAAAEKLAFAQEAVIGTESAVSAARTTLSRSTAALAAAQNALGLALKANDAALVATTEETLALAAAQRIEAEAALQAALANTGVGRSTANATKGIVAQTAALFGLRAGTLAASSGFIAGTVGVLAFAKAVQSAAQTQTELNVFRVTAKATADEMARVAEEAKALGRDITLPGVTAQEAAQSMTTLAKAGLDVEDSMNGARGALELATAAQIDVADASNLIAGALNAFQLAGSDAVRVADLLTGAAQESQGEITDMGTALSQAAAVAHTFGLDIEDTIALITELARAGISGGRAGTSLRIAILRLVNPTKDAAEKLKELNIQVRDASGNFRPEVFTDITQALKGYSVAQQQATQATIFGADAIRTSLIVGNQGAEAFRNIRDAVSEAGLAQEAAAARTQGLQGDFENLSNQLSALGLTIGQAATGPISALVKGLADVAAGMNVVADASINVGGRITDFAKSVGNAVPFLDDLSSHLGDLAKASFLFNPGTGIFVALAGLGRQSDKATVDVGELRAEILNLVKAGQTTGGDLGLNQTLVALDALVAKLREGGPEAQKFATEVQTLRGRLAQAAGQGFKLFPDDVESLFPPALLTGEVAKKAGEKNVDALVGALEAKSPQLFQSAFDFFNQIKAGIETATPDVVKTAQKSAAQVANALAEGVAKAQEAQDVARARGSEAGELAGLRDEARAQQAIVDAANARVKAIGAGNKGFATAVAARRKAVADLAQVNEQIRSIEEANARDAKQAQDKRIADAKQAAADAARAASAREQAVLKAQGLARDQRQNAIARAAETGGLQDDIAQQKKLKALVLQQIQEVRDRISAEGGRAAAITALRAILIQIDKQQADLIAQQQETRQRQRDALLQGISLDIAFDQTTDNVKKEVSDRQRLINELKKDLAKTKEGTLAYKEIRNQIAEQTKAIEDLTAAKKQQNNAVGQAQFEFLQAQQGFASNLLGNLIPTGSTAGLVGVTSAAPVAAALTPVAGAAEARSSGGPTAGQAQSTNAILLRILDQMKIANGGQAAPEAKGWWSWQRAQMDGVGGG